MQDNERINAPWSEKVVELLIKYQKSSQVHPYTCGTTECVTKYGWDFDSTHLKPTTEGWVCPLCDYKQNWVSKVVLDMARALK